jgi:uncharacterized protein
MRLWLLALWALWIGVAPAAAAGPSFPDWGRAAVVDAAGVIPDEQEAQLNARIVAWVHSSGHQLAVVTVPSLDGQSIEDYANGLLRHWGLGRAGANDGAILLLAPNDRQVRIEVGYGLEGVLTDAVSSQIIAQTIAPALRQGDIAGALSAGADRIMAAAVLDPAEARAMTLAATQAQESRSLPWGMILLIGIPAIIGGLFAFDRYAARRMRKQAEEYERNRIKSEQQRRARQKRKWEKEKAEGRTTFATFEDYYADFLARERARDERRWQKEKANQPRSRGYSSSGTSVSWSSSDRDYGDSSSSSWDSGYDSGGGTGGGGGASSSY